MAWSGCVAGALLEEEYREKLTSAGYTDVEVEVTRRYDLTDPMACEILPNLSESDRASLNGTVVSAFIRGKKLAVL